MGVYSIKDLENFTKIKAHTLRIWEQRYNLLSPERTETNIRLYSDRDLKKILNINLLYSNGLKISKIAKLQESEIFRLANEILVPGENDASIVDSTINKIMQFDEAGIIEDLEAVVLKDSLENVFSNQIIKTLEKIGELWQVDCLGVAHEHFYSNILRAFLVRKTPVKIDKKKCKGTALLFLRESEYHEIGLLFYNYFLRKRNYNTIYLGQTVPLENIPDIIKLTKPDCVFTSLIAKLDPFEFKDFFTLIGDCINLNKLHVGGYQLLVYEDLIPDKVNVIHRADGIKIN